MSPRILQLGTLSLASLVAAAVALPATAEEKTTGDKQKASSAADQEWLTITGKVASVEGNHFMVDYGSDDIMVEMDDYDWYNENALRPGDTVTIAGRMDNDFFESKKIEASSVYVDSLNEHFFASAADEEEATFVAIVHDQLVDDEYVSLTGKVTKVDGQNIIVDAGLYEYDVDANGLSYNPFDNEGAERIQVGERVAVYGRMDDADLFDDREIEASSIITLSSNN